MNPLTGKEETWQSSFQTATEHNYESEEGNKSGQEKKKAVKYATSHTEYWQSVEKYDMSKKIVLKLPKCF